MVDLMVELMVNLIVMVEMQTVELALCYRWDLSSEWMLDGGCRMRGDLQILLVLEWIESGRLRPVASVQNSQANLMRLGLLAN